MTLHSPSPNPEPFYKRPSNLFLYTLFFISNSLFCVRKCCFVFCDFLSFFYLFNFSSKNEEVEAKAKGEERSNLKQRLRDFRWTNFRDSCFSDFLFSSVLSLVRPRPAFVGIVRDDFPLTSLVDQDNSDSKYLWRHNIHIK